MRRKRSKHYDTKLQFESTTVKNVHKNHRISHVNIYYQQQQDHNLYDV